MRVCSRHFPAGDATKQPQLNLGKRFASPRKKSAPREVRARRRDANKKMYSSLFVLMFHFQYSQYLHCYSTFETVND